MTIDDVPEPFVNAFKAQGIKDPNTILGHYIVSGKETKARGGSENMDYSNTPNARIRDVFGARGSAIAKMPDAQLNWLKQDPERFGRFIYGGQQGTLVPDVNRGFKLTYKSPEAQAAADDGWTYRGGGHLQLTGKDQYDKVSRILFPDDPEKLLRDPDLVRRDPQVGLDASAAYAKIYGKADKRTAPDPVTAINQALTTVGGGAKFGPGGRMYGQQVQGINNFIKNHNDPKFQQAHKDYYASIGKPEVSSSAQTQTAEPEHWYSKFIPGAASILPSGFQPTPKDVAQAPVKTVNVKPVAQPVAQPEGPGVLDTVKQFGQDVYQKFNNYMKPQASLEPHTPAGALNTTFSQGTTPPPAVANNPIKQ